MPGRLDREISPYLQEHSGQPVHWRPWGQAALAEARALDRPLLVSIGYLGSPGCQMMARESYSDPKVAALINERFIAVKVDRDELPEVDAIYGSARAIMGEPGGLPLLAFCLPDGRPYYLSGYLARVEHAGRPSLARALEAMADAYAGDRARILENAVSLVEGLAEAEAHMRGPLASGAPGFRSAAAIARARDQIVAHLDPVHGGLVGAPKFPCAPIHAFLMASGDEHRGAMNGAVAWAMAMVDGGLFDRADGGFFRACSDAAWQRPLPEKSLSDNAQLLGNLASVRRWCDDAQRGRVDAAARATMAWIANRLRRDDGGLAMVEGGLVGAGACGLAVRGLVAWHRATSDAAARELAEGAGAFVQRVLWREGVLLRLQGSARAGLLPDYAYVAAACLDLEELTGVADWGALAGALLERIAADFFGENDGGVAFYLTPPLAAAETLQGIIHRVEVLQDQAEPSAAAVAVASMSRYARRAGDVDARTMAWCQVAERYLAERLGGTPSPFVQATLLAAPLVAH